MIEIQSSDDDRIARLNANLFDVIRDKKLSQKQQNIKLKKLIREGAAVNYQNNKGKTILHVAIEKSFEEVVNFLLRQKGIQIDIQDHNGKTVTELVDESVNFNIIQSVYNFGKKLQVKDMENDVIVIECEANVAHNEKTAVKQKNEKDKSEVLALKKNKRVDDKTNNEPQPGPSGYVPKRKLQEKEENDNLKKLKSVEVIEKEFQDTSLIPSEGLKLTEHGNIFQLKLLMLVLLRASEQNGVCGDFRLATELDEAEKFDDVVFQYQDWNGKWKFRLIQAKHREGLDSEEKLEKVNEKDFLSEKKDDPFALFKYFRSFLRIKQRINYDSIYSIFPNSEVEDLILITNVNLDCERLKMSCMESINHDKLLKVGEKFRTTTTHKFKNETNKFLVNELRLICENTSDFRKLVEKFVDCILNDEKLDLDSEIVKYYFHPLMHNVLEKSQSETKKNDIELKFRDEFIEGNLDNAFRDALLRELVVRDGLFDFHSISESFGKTKISLAKQEILAEKIAKVIANQEELTIDEFIDCHIALKSQVLDVKHSSFSAYFFSSAMKDFRNIVKKKVQVKLPDKNVTVEFLTKVRFKASENFGNSKLSNDANVLNRLAETLKNSLKNNQELKPSLSQDLEHYHIILANEVIDVQKKSFHDSFLKNKGLSHSAKKLRQILIQTGEYSNSVKTKLNCQLKATDGFIKKFNPSKKFRITNPEEFAKQMHSLLTVSVTGRRVEVNRETAAAVAQVPFVNIRKFKENFQKLAGYVLIISYDKVRFSTTFLLGDRIDASLEAFRDKLKKLLGAENFKTIFELEFVFGQDFKFVTCEEEAFHRKLPVEPKSDDFIEFFEKFKLIVNFPNRVEIDELLGDEIKAKTKNLNEKTFSSLLKNEMHNWMASRMGTFFTAGKAKKLFDDIKDVLTSWKIEGISIPYFASASSDSVLKEKDILSDFLVDTTKSILHVSCNQLYFARIRIVQTFKTLQNIKSENNDLRNYTWGNGYIFLRLTHFEAEEIKAKVVKCCQDNNSWNLVVIEFDSTDKTQKFLKTLTQLAALIVEKRKKLIFLAKSDDKFVEILQNNYADKLHKKDIVPQFDDFTKESQEKLSNCLVNFQGIQVKLNSLISVKELNKVLDSETLGKLIKNKEIVISTQLFSSLDFDENSYVSRGFDEIEISKDIFNEKEKTFTDQIVVQQENGVEEKFFRNENNKSCHWLKEKSGKFIWQKSQGSLKSLQNFRKAKSSEQKQEFLSENDLVKEDRFKILIISDTAGSGKSMVTTSLSKKIQQDNNHCWVIRLNLNDCTKELEIEKEKRKAKKPSFTTKTVKLAVDFLLKLMSEKLSNFSEGLLRHSLDVKRNVAILFDGFDEISPNYKEIVITLLKALKKRNLHKIIVTTRPHMKKDLENGLEILSYTLKPFTNDQQKEFLQKFWNKKFDLSDKENDRVKTFANDLIDQFHEEIIDRDNQFGGNPLHIRMLAEVFEKFVKSDSSKPQKLDLFFLYSEFIKKKINEIYFVSKLKKDVSNLGVQEENKVLYDNIIKNHQNLALHSFFNDKTLELLTSKSCADLKKELNSFKSELKMGKERKGLIDRFSENGKPHFVHLTFSEFMIADFLAEQIRNHDKAEKLKKFFIEEIFHRSKYEVVCIFLSSKLEIMFNEIPKRIMLSYGKYIDDFNAVVKIDSSEESELGTSDESDESDEKFSEDDDKVLHIAAKEGNLGLVKLMAKSNVNVKNSLGSTPLHLTYHVDLAKFLIENGAIINVKNDKGQTPLYFAVYDENFAMAELLMQKSSEIEKKILIHEKSYSRESPLRLAIENDDIKIVELFCKNGAIVDASLLQEVWRMGKSKIVKMLIVGSSMNKQNCPMLCDKKDDPTIIEPLIGIDYNRRGFNGATILHEAVLEGFSKITKFLISKGVDTNAEDDSGETPLHLAVLFKRMVIVKMLVKVADVDKICYKGMTPLNLAIKEKRTMFAKFLLSCGVDVNKGNNAGHSPLFHAILDFNFEMAKALIEKRCHINLQCNDGCDPALISLYSTAKGETTKRTEILKLLITNGANIGSSVKDKEGNTLLHYAVRKKHFGVVTLLCNNFSLIDKKVSINFKNNKNQEPIDLAISDSHEIIKKFLLEKR